MPSVQNCTAANLVSPSKEALQRFGEGDLAKTAYGFNLFQLRVRWLSGCPRLTLLFFGVTEDVPEAAEMVTAGIAFLRLLGKPVPKRGTLLTPVSAAGAKGPTPCQGWRHEHWVDAPGSHEQLLEQQTREGVQKAPALASTSSGTKYCSNPRRVIGVGIPSNDRQVRISIPAL